MSKIKPLAKIHSEWQKGYGFCAHLRWKLNPPTPPLSSETLSLARVSSQRDLWDITCVYLLTQLSHKSFQSLIQTTFASFF